MSALEELARSCGIQEKRVDARGTEHITTPETKKALLNAMGWNAADEQAAQQSLIQFEDENWHAVLPPVFVAYTDRGPMEIPLVLSDDAAEVHWTISLEEGSKIEGRVRFSELSLQDSRTKEGRKQERRTLAIADELPWGYHHLWLEGQEETSLLIVTPGTCWLPDKSDERRFWGLAVQLYLMRSVHNWGVGDFTDLRQLVKLAYSKGADVIGLNPLHAMFLDKPGEASPYSPSDRLLLNVWNIDLESIPEFAQSEKIQNLVSSNEFQARLDKCRKAELLDYDTVASLKLPVLRMLFSAFLKCNDSDRMEAFESFHHERRTLLDRACLFQALREYLSSHGNELADGESWPEAYKNFRSSGVAEFAETNAELIRFHLWLQWVADSQLAEAADAASKMAIGLYCDLAVGAHPQGAEVWSYPESLVSEASIGAPPDIWNPVGQNWGLPPLHPFRAGKDRYTSFIEIIRANMRHAGALRIDHAMALQRLYWIPNGASPKDGAYVSYPTDDLVGILALESHRNRCLVIGEDLGTVPEGFRERMAQAKILSYRVLFFERDEDSFFRPEEYPRLALSVASSHDLPTLRGWWEAADIDTKERLNLYPEGPEEARKQREADRQALLEALRKESILNDDQSLNTEEFCEAAHKFLARSKSLLTLLQIDDVAQEREQVNVPSTTDENPNWRRRLSITLEELAADSRLDRIASDLGRTEQG